MPKTLAVGVLAFVVMAITALATLQRGRNHGPGELYAEQTRIEMQGSGDQPDSIRGGKASFSILNIGGTTVTVSSVESGCGCTKASIEPSIIEPGKTAIVTADVSASALIGAERTVSIGVLNDSQAAPRLNLEIHIADTRKAPFLGGVFGDLVFLDPEVGEEREIEVHTFEPNGAESTPIVASDIPCISFEMSGIVEKPYELDGNAVRKVRKYRAIVRADPSNKEYNGRVSYEDKRNGLSGYLFAQIKRTPALRLMPSRVRLNANSTRENTAEATVLVRFRSQSDDFSISLEGEGSSLLDVRKGERDADSNTQAFTIGLRRGVKPVAGTYNVVVRSKEGGDPPATVPVLVDTH
jgi:hypothetical protein